MNNHCNIIKAVDKSIEKICRKFQSHPTLFYTENDLVCYFYYILQRKLSFLHAYDKDCYKHYLVHMEYPTPFKCDMSKNNFEIKGDNDDFQRGHYDVVVLNPDFINDHCYKIIKAQNFDEIKAIKYKVREKYAMILYGLEFFYYRDRLTPAHIGTINSIVDKIIQDAKKLKVSKDEGYIKKIKSLVFIKGCPEDVREELKKQISTTLNNEKLEMCLGKEIILCCDDFNRCSTC